MPLIVWDQWTLIDWDGNPDLHYKCWRKSFGGGHVSVGVGEFLNVVYSYGPNSHRSLSSTRWNYGNPLLTPEQVMAAVDLNDGKHGNIGHNR
jgi:hypothetical protein